MGMISSNKRSMMAEINMTPFVDVMLVLLIVFMITAPMLQQGLPVNLPQAQSSELKRTKQDLIVTIQKDGKVYIGDNKKSVEMNSLEGRLQAIYATKQRKDIFIKADFQIQYGDVIKVMSAAKKAGVDRIGMLTQPELRLKN